MIALWVKVFSLTCASSPSLLLSAVLPYKVYSFIFEHEAEAFNIIFLISTKSDLGTFNNKHFICKTTFLKNSFLIHLIDKLICVSITTDIQIDLYICLFPKLVILCLPLVIR